MEKNEISPGIERQLTPVQRSLIALEKIKLIILQSNPSNPVLFSVEGVDSPSPYSIKKKYKEAIKNEI